MIIEGIEISITNKSKCKSCGNSIKEGEPKGYFYNPKYYNSKSSVCWKCTEKKLEEQTKDSQNMLKEFQILKKKKAKILICSQLENGK